MPNYQKSYPKLANMALAGTSFTYAASHAGAGDAPAGNNVTVHQMAEVDVVLQLRPRIIGEVQFKFAEQNFRSIGGTLYTNYNPVTGVGTACGSIDKLNGIARFKPKISSRTYVDQMTILNLATNDHGTDDVGLEQISFRTSLTNVNPGSVQIRGSKVQVSVTQDTDAAGNPVNREVLTTETGFTLTVNTADSSLQGDADLTGSVSAANGIVTITALNDWYIVPSSIRYDAVSESRIPMSAELLGLNPVRLPASGRVPVINDGGTLVIFHEQDQAVTPAAGATVSCGRTDVALMEVVDAEGLVLSHHQYTVDLAAGTLTFADPLTLETLANQALTAPFKLVDRIENMRLASNVDITGRVTLATPPDRTFPAGSLVADALVYGDIGARVYNLFHQESWNSGAPVWSDQRIGDDTTARYDAINYRIEIVNLGSTTERWAIRFINSTTIQVIGEQLGVVLDNHSISLNGHDIAPINPATGTPYFIMRQAGFGSGWLTNNVVRFNTEGGNQNAWLIRTTQPGAATESKDSIVLEQRGDAN